jgi:hypothetical protein
MSNVYYFSYFRETLVAFLPFAAVAVALFWMAKSVELPKHKSWHPPSTPPGDLFAPIRETDPTFTWEAFRARAIAAYVVIQRARMVRQPAMAREWMTPRLFVGLSNSIRFVEAGRVARTIAPITVTRIEPVRVLSKDDHFLFDVRILGQTSRDAYDVIMGAESEPVFTSAAEDLACIDEIWTFRRKIGAQTSPDVSNLCCPNCGAPVRRPNAENCEYCGRSLNRVVDEWKAAMFAPTQFMNLPEENMQPSEAEAT